MVFPREPNKKNAPGDRYGAKRVSHAFEGICVQRKRDGASVHDYAARLALSSISSVARVGLIQPIT